MARRIKSLHFNLQDGENIPFHREHRSKKGRNKPNHSTNEYYFQYKMKKKGLDNKREKNKLALLLKGL